MQSTPDFLAETRRAVDAGRSVPAHRVERLLGILDDKPILPKLNDEPMEEMEDATATFNDARERCANRLEEVAYDLAGRTDNCHSEVAVEQQRRAFAFRDAATILRAMKD